MAKEAGLVRRSALGMGIGRQAREPAQPSQRHVAVVPDPVPGLDHDQVDPQRMRRQPHAAGQPVSEQSPDRRAEMRALPMVQALLGHAEVAPPAPADLDDDQLGRRPGIDRDDVQLAAADVNVAGEEPPAGGQQRPRGESPRMTSANIPALWSPVA